jgi:hypothetical protein
MTTSLFDLHRTFKRITLRDDDGKEMEIALRSLDQETTEQLLDHMIELRAQEERPEEQEKLKEKIRVRVRDYNDEQILDLILNIESQTVEHHLDLAPNATDADKAAALIEASKKWSEQRTAQLKMLSPEELRRTYYEEQLRVSTQSQAVSKFLAAQIATIVVDPMTHEPLVSEDPKAKNYIGRLMLPTRNALRQAVSEFINAANDRALRAIATSSDFLPSGALPEQASDSPGATTSSPSTSPSPVSASSPSGSG